MSKQCIPSDGKDIGCKNVVLKTSKQALPFLKVGNIGWNSSLDQSTIKTFGYVYEKASHVVALGQNRQNKIPERGEFIFCWLRS